jgi:hypothetical protein
VAPELFSHQWRAIGHLAGRCWYNTDPSLSLLTTRLQSFMLRLDPSVHRYVLQGVGEFLFDRFIEIPWVLAAELEHFPPAYQEGLLEGWGMALGEVEQFHPLPWHTQETALWIPMTKGFSARSLTSIQRGKAQFDALFEGAASNLLEPPLGR